MRDRRTAAEWASAEQVIEISEKIGSLDKLATVVEADLLALDAARMPANWRDAEVSGDLEFAFLDAAGRVPGVTGRVMANVDAVCQRCLEPFQLSLEVEPKLVLLNDETSLAGFDEYEVWELDERMLRPSDIVEEMLIMAMPFSAMHDNRAECSALASDGAVGVEDSTRPFASLREQMERK